MTRRLLGVSALVAVASLAACGDNAPSKKEFLAKADPVCKASTAEATALGTPTDVGGLRQFHIKLADGADRTLAGLDKVKLPGGDDGKAAKAWVQALRDAAAAARAVPPEVDKSNYTGIETTAGRAAEAFKAADSQARTFGSAECGRGEAEAVERMRTALPKTVKTAYITAADAICKSAFTKFEALPEAETPAEFKTFMEQAVALEEKLLADLKAIAPPVTDKDKLDPVFLGIEKVIAKDKEALAALAAGNERKAYDLVEESDNLSDDSAAKADAYGFVDCGSQSS